MRGIVAAWLGLGCGACVVAPSEGPPIGGEPVGSSGADTPEATTGQQSPDPVTDSGESSAESSAGSDTTPAVDDTQGPATILDVGTMPDTPPLTKDCETGIDIVFVLDVSTSMDTVLNQLAAEIEAVDQSLADLGLAEEARYGLAVFVDDAALLNDGQPFATIPELQQEFEDWADWTALGTQLAPVGFLNYTWPENSLDALHFAASDFAWRDIDTTLRIVIVSTDDTFWDGPTQQNGVAIVHGYEDTVAALQAAQARVFAFTADIGGQCECEDVTAGWSAPYGVLASIPDATDGGRFDIDQIVGGGVSFADAIAQAVDESYCTEYEPAG